MTHILAIDPANRTGFAHSDGYRGAVDLVRQFDRHRGNRLIRFATWLRSTLKSHPTDLLAAEDASFGSHNPNVQAQHNELRGVIHMVAAEFEIDVKLFTPSTIKAFATDNGRAKKHQMMAALHRHFGIVETDNDVADAIWILELAKQPDCWSVSKAKKPRRKESETATRMLFK